MGTAPDYVTGHGLLADRTVLVTAAAGTGIGSSTARRCLEEGATVVISDRHERRVGETADALIQRARVLVRQGAFPDAVSDRGRKHLAELAGVVGPDTRALMFYCVFHEGITRVCAAGDIDPKYRQALLDAQAAGVEVQAWAASVAPEGLVLERELPFAVDPEPNGD